MQTKTFTDSRFSIHYKIDGPYPVDAGQDRFLHGPCLTRCRNGDWLCAYQDSSDDPGRNSFIRQKRSCDGGLAWLDEGIIYDEENKGFGCRNPAFGQTPDGKIIMIVQRIGLRRLGIIRGENIMGSCMLISGDSGKTYTYKGLADPQYRQGNQGCSTHLVYHQGKLYMPAFHTSGLVLYISSDDGETWPHRIMVAPKKSLPERPAYPTLVARPDGTLLFIAHLNRAIRCFGRISSDNGFTWGDIFYYDDLQLRHPVLQYLNRNLLCIGRNMEYWKPAFCVSPDDGKTWSDPIDPFPERGQGGGYTAVWPSGKISNDYLLLPARVVPIPPHRIFWLFI